MLALYLLFPLPPLLSPVVSAATADYTAAAYDYVVDDSTATVELPGKQPFPSPTYRLSVYIYLCTRHMLLLRYVLFQLHSLSLSPLDYLFRYPMQPDIHNIYSSGPCALLVIG